MPKQSWRTRNVMADIEGASSLPLRLGFFSPVNSDALRQRWRKPCPSKKGRPPPLTSRECREQGDRFAALGLEVGISVRRATILMAIADSWSRLAGQLDRLEALEAHEKP
jgi:hypothetical protein